MTGDASVERDEALARARAAWPSIAVSPERFRRALDAAGPGPWHAEDLHLALACATGDGRAIAAFEEHFGPEIARALARLRLGSADVEEIHQRLRHKLFSAEPGADPKIARYSGRGALRAWLRAIAVHEAMSEHRRRARARDHAGDSVLGELAADDDPELEQIRARCAAPFRAAFAAAVAALSARDRNVLRLVYQDGVSIEQVAVLYGVHRVSVSRWLGQARKDLLEATRARLRVELNLGDSELASVTRLCLSQIAVSLDRLLAR